MAKQWTGPVLIPTEPPDVLSGAARVFALLAYPECGRDKARDRLVEAVLATIARRVVADRKHRGQSPLKAGLPRSLLAVRKRDVDNRIRDALPLWNHRIMATEICSELIDDVAVPGPISIGPAPGIGVRGFQRSNITITSPFRKEEAPRKRTRREIMFELYRDHAPADPGFIDSTVKRCDWEQSLPVLHLSMAVKSTWIELYAAHPDWRDRYFVECMIANPDWVGDVIKRAEFWRALLPRLLRDVPADRLIPIEAVPTLATARRLYDERRKTAV